MIQPSGLRHDPIPLPASGPVAEPFSIGRARNLHLLCAGYLKPLQALCLEYGGLNPYRKPNYRLVYGWQCPNDYVGENLDLFHIQRWLPTLDTEESWAAKEKLEAARHGGLYIPEPYPRQGNYHHIETSRLGKKGFLWPRREWVIDVILENLERQKRTPDQIRLELEADRQRRKRLENEKAAKTGDKYQVRELAEKEAALLIANPSLRRDPSLLLSPAVSYKRTKKAVRSNL